MSQDEFAEEVRRILAADPEGGPAALLRILHDAQTAALQAQQARAAAVIEAVALMAGYGEEGRQEP